MHLQQNDRFPPNIENCVEQTFQRENVPFIYAIFLHTRNCESCARRRLVSQRQAPNLLQADFMFPENFKHNNCPTIQFV